MRSPAARLNVPCVALALLSAACCEVGAAAGTDGIWKAVVPAPGTMHGEFDNDDPIGLTAGVRIRADCSINWVDPDAGKLYCFASATSLVFFLDAPRAYLERARTQWLRLKEGAR